MSESPQRNSLPPRRARKALLGVITTAITESRNGHSVAFLRKCSKQLGLSEDDANAFLPLLQLPSPPQNEAGGDISPFLLGADMDEVVHSFLLLFVRGILASEEGYDARTMAVMSLVGSWVMKSDGNIRFHHISSYLTRRILTSSSKNSSDPLSEKKTLTTKSGWMRAAKIATTTVAATTVFAVTGGIAAPAIAAGMAGVLSSMGAAAGIGAFVGFITSTSVFTAIFGGVGGGLATWKMSRRTQGVKEFEFIEHKKENSLSLKLTYTICISGWLRDSLDFERPWGTVNLNGRDKKPSRLELLQRFYFVNRVDNVEKSGKILKKFKGREVELWEELRRLYGETPDRLTIKTSSPTSSPYLDDENWIDLFLSMSGFELDEKGGKIAHSDENDGKSDCRSYESDNTVNPSFKYFCEDEKSTDDCVEDGMNDGGEGSGGVGNGGADNLHENTKLDRVWDISENRPAIGDLFTVYWERAMLEELSYSVNEIINTIAVKGTKEILRHTFMASLVTAAMLPMGLVGMLDSIDGSWTLACERADEAGRLLALALIERNNGQRPVNLIGYSFGARIIFSCLKELRRLQLVYEKTRESAALSDANGEDSEEEELNLSEEEAKFARLFWREPRSIVHDVVFMGLPSHIHVEHFKSCLSLAAGRVINVYSNNDYVLKLLFQSKRVTGALLKGRVCGCAEVDVEGIENVDCSDLIATHRDYCTQVQDILERIKLK